MKTLLKEELKNTSLSNIQIELLTLFQTNVDDKTLKDIRKLLKHYFAKKAVGEADKLWNEKQFSDEYMDQILAGEK